MEENLGAVEQTLLAPEKLRTEKPFWKDLLSGFVTILIPMLIVGWTVAGLMEDAGLTRTFGWILTTLVILVLTPFAVFVMRRQTTGYIRQRLEIREQGVSGVCMMNALRTREFAFSYAELKSVSARKKVLSLAAGKEKVNLVLDEAEAVAQELRQRIA